MSTTIVLHTENKEKLHNFFSYFNKNYKKSDFNILVHSKDYYPWQDESLYKEIITFKSYYCYNTVNPRIDSVIELLLKTKTTNVVDILRKHILLRKIY